MTEFKPWTELKPCPFCGSKDVIIKQDDSCGHTVICFKCNAKTDRCLSQKLAVEAWNRRIEMTDNNYNNTKVYLRKKYEMCNFTNCFECPLSENNNGKSLACYLYDSKYPEEAIAAVREWHESSEKKFTYKDDFFGKFPNAAKTSDGYPKDLIACVFYPQIRDKYNGDCSDHNKCWDMEKED